MDRILIKAVGILFQGIIQVVIDMTVRAEVAEQQVQELQKQRTELLKAMQGASPPAHLSRVPQTAEAEAGG